MSFWHWLFSAFSADSRRRDGAPMWVEGFWIGEPVKLPNKVSTPMGSHVSVVELCVDVEYVIRDQQIVLRQVRMSRKGTPGPSGRGCNVASTNVGETWHVTYFSPNAFLVSIVEDELRSSSLNLRRIMFGKWNANRQPSADAVAAVVDALNRKAPAAELDELIQRTGRRCRLTFTYDSPKKGAEQRVVIVRRASGDAIRATDARSKAEAAEKTFRLDRISNARQI